MAKQTKNTSVSTPKKTTKNPFSTVKNRTVAEIAALAAAAHPTPSTNPEKKLSFWRLLLIGLLGIIAFNAIMGGIFALWANRTFLNTDEFTSIVGELPNNPSVRNTLAKETGNIIVSSVPAAELAKQLNVPVISGAAAEQIKEQLRPAVQATVLQIVASPAFANLWATSVENAHRDALNQLESSDDLNINLRPLLEGIIGQLKGTQLEFLQAQIQLPKDAGMIAIKDEQFTRLAQSYTIAKQLFWILVAAAAVATILAMLLAVKKLAVLRKLAISVLIASTLIIISATYIPKILVSALSGSNADTLESASSISRQFSRDLVFICMVAAAIAALVIIVTILISLRKRHLNSEQSKRGLLGS